MICDSPDGNTSTSIPNRPPNNNSLTAYWMNVSGVVALVAGNVSAPLSTNGLRVIAPMIACVVLSTMLKLAARLTYALYSSLVCPLSFGTYLVRLPSNASSVISYLRCTPSYSGCGVDGSNLLLIIIYSFCYLLKS